jgi:zinc transport system substrate-binding protein
MTHVTFRMRRLVRVVPLLLVIAAMPVTAADRLRVVATTVQITAPLVVATVYPLYEFAREVAGDRAEVALLVPPGVEPHDWEPAPQDIARLQKARLFIYNGAGFEPWVDKLRKDLAAKGTVMVRTTEKVALLKAGADHGHGSKPAKPGHAHRDPVDPHVWLDPVRAQAQVEAIRAGLARVDPTNATIYDTRAQAYKAKLAALDLSYQAGLKSCARKEVVTTHAAFTYLTRRYGLTQLAIHGLAPDAEPSPADLARLVQIAKDKRVTHIFFETLVSSKLAETLAREVGAQTLVLNPVEGLTREQQAAGLSYLTLMEDNLRHLRTALDCR